MLKNKSKIIAIFLILILAFSSSFVLADNEASNSSDVQAISTGTEQNNVENTIKDEITNQQTQEDSYKKSDVYLVDDEVTIDYIVDGNLFVCANKVTINSQIGGDAFILAKELTITDQAYIFSNLFTCAQSVDIKGVVYDVYAVSENFSLSGGYVYRDLKVSCNTLNINGTVGRNAFVNCSKINFNTDSQNKGIIYGNLEYTSSSESTIPDGVVSGEIKFHEDVDSSASVSTAEIIKNYIINLGEFLAFLLIIWVVCLLIAPKFLDSTNNYVGKQTLGIFGKGFLALVAIPVACFILLLLQLTGGVSLLLLALYILALVISKSLFIITANKYICTKLNINKNLGIFGMLIVTGIVIWVLTQLPYIGGLISFIMIVIGLGILVTSILPKKQKSDKEVIENTNEEK